MESNNSTDRSLTADEAYARMIEELPSEFPAATKSRLDPDAPDLDSNWLHTHTVLRRGSNTVEAQKAGAEPWKVVIQIDSESATASVTADEVLSAIRQANQYADDRAFDDMQAAQESQPPASAALEAILPQVIAAAPDWALTPTVDDMFGPVNGEIEVQYDGPDLVGAHAGWDARANLSKTVVFSADGEILEALPVVPNVYVDDHVATVASHSEYLEMLLDLSAGLARLASDYRAVIESASAGRQTAAEATDETREA